MEIINIATNIQNIEKIKVMVYHKKNGNKKYTFVFINTDETKQLIVIKGNNNRIKIHRINRELNHLPMAKLGLIPVEIRKIKILGHYIITTINSWLQNY